MPRRSLTANRMVRLPGWPQALLWAVHSDTGRFAVGDTVRIDQSGTWPLARILDKDGSVLLMEILEARAPRARDSRGPLAATHDSRTGPRVAAHISTNHVANNP